MKQRERTSNEAVDGAKAWSGRAANEIKTHVGVTIG